MGFRHTTHERCLYTGTIDGKKVLVCRQVDDFAIGSESAEINAKFIAKVNEYVTTNNQGQARVYNGVDIIQTRDYIKVSCETYIDRVLQTHGWETPGPKESDRHDSVPMKSDAVPPLFESEGPKEGTPEYAELERKM